MNEQQGRKKITAWGVPSIAVLATFVVIAVAAIGFFATGHRDNEPRDDNSPVAQSTTTQPSPTTAPPTPTPTPTPTHHPKAKKTDALPRAYVAVFNNTRTSGLAQAASAKVQGAGWKVVGVDNWYGSIPETTVYYPKRLKKQAEQLAKDVGISRVRPSISPMSGDRLTLILTGAV